MCDCFLIIVDPLNFAYRLIPLGKALVTSQHVYEDGTKLKDIGAQLE